MTPEQFRAAVEKIIGVPASSDHAWFWQLETSHDGLHMRLPGTEAPDLYFREAADSPFDILMGFDDGFSPGLGENPHTGRWHIRAEDFNNDPEAVLRELTRRLAKAGYTPPEVSPTAEVKPGLTVGTAFTKTWNRWLDDSENPGGLCKFEAGFRDMFEEGWTARDASGLKPGVPVSGCVIGLTKEERRHLTALMETAVEPPENRPPGMVGSIWQGQQDAWASILKKLQG